MLKIRCQFLRKIQAIYFEISALYFKIYGLYFSRNALCFRTYEYTEFLCSLPVHLHAQDLRTYGACYIFYMLPVNENEKNAYFCT